MATPLNVETTLVPSSTSASAGASLGSCFPSEFPYEFDSVPELESGDESVEDEEDAFFAGLTRRLTQQQLAAMPEKKRTVAGSPESTLCGKGSCWSVSSNGSPNSAPSPPLTPFGDMDDTLKLIHAAAGEIARLKMATRNTVLALGQNSLSVMDAPNPNPCPNPGGNFMEQKSSHPASDLFQYQKQSVLVGKQQDQLLKQGYGYLLEMQQPQHLVDQTFQPLQQQQHFLFRGGSGLTFEKPSSGRPLGVPPSTWGPLHLQQQRAGMRSIYLAGSVGVKREHAGTGVFLPRKYGTNPTPDCGKKKAGGSPVLLPARMVQALNLNLDGRNMQGLAHPRPNCGLALSDYDIVMARRAAILAQQKQSLRTEAVVNNELRLPQEWTY